jgi:predicted ATPase/class 3 adenylate cyclase
LAQLPTGTVTFLFSDIEGSTRLWEEFPDAMQECLARHDEILRDSIAVNDGVIVKTTGDGVHAAFATAAGGVAAALDAQRAIRASPWETIGDLRVRMGLHTGEAEVRDGDYYGSVLNRAARLMSVAHGDQIVISQVTEGLARDSLAAEITLVDLGDHRLRDLASPIRVFQVVHPALPREFPRLRSLEAYAGNLPVQLTSFVGRDDDVVNLAAALADAPLVTLTGTGGVGKTRLAIQAAAEVVHRFTDGVWFCELATASDGDLMVQGVANTIGCVQRPGLSMADSIVEYLKVRNVLLVLDNCEHLLDDAGDLADSILQSCPAVKVLATSREALEIGGERVVRVRSLRSPDPNASPEEWQENAAIRLFKDRAFDAGATGAWTAEQQASIGEICRRVDGIPLAIELAAARVASMTPAEIAEHLDERFRLLTGKRRGRVERHQTLRATVEWSYQLLEPDDRTVFNRLGIFAGTFDAVAAGAIVSDDELDRWRVIDSVASLVAKSMLVAEDGLEGTTRYSMLETLRQFSRDQLDQHDDADHWRRRHAEHYAQFAEAGGEGFKGSDDLAWGARVSAELDNIRSAVAWGVDRDDPADGELALRTIAALSYFAQENRSSAIDVLASHAIDVALPSRAELRAPTLALASYHEMNRGNPERARVLANDALRDGVLVGSPFPFLPHENLAFVEILTGNQKRAREILTVARDSLGMIDDHYLEAHLLSVCAAYFGLAGDVDQARADGERSLELARGLGNRTLIAEVSTTLAYAIQRDQPEAALRSLELGIETLREGWGTSTGSAALALAGGIKARLGDEVGALRYLHGAVTVSRDQGARPSMAAALDWSLRVLVRMERPDTAAVFVGALTAGALSEVSDYPISSPRTRDRILGRVRETLGGDATQALVDRGAAMTYEEIVDFAVEQLEPPPTDE